MIKKITSLFCVRSLLVVYNATCLLVSDRGPQNSLRQEATYLRLPFSVSFEHHAGDSTIWLGFDPILKENISGGTSLPLPPTSREDLRLKGYLEYPYAAKNLGGRTGKILRPSSVALKSKNQEINRLQLAVKLPWAIFFESVDILS
ncbi:hypothetical protein TNCV_939391 [Trichonephila clavipes]|nr:hypothetical protein TNCV_939391 [Trichonephila clavipes]